MAIKKLEIDAVVVSAPAELWMLAGVKRTTRKGEIQDGRTT